tara:strand:+ start:447 stop:953 length:507 start_codon:yes stop_codon:yes gene_type:complete
MPARFEWQLAVEHTRGDAKLSKERERETVRPWTKDGGVRLQEGEGGTKRWRVRLPREKAGKKEMAREIAKREGGGGEEHRCQEACGVRMRRVRMRRVRMRRCGVRMRRVRLFACSRKSLSRNPRSTELTKISDRPGIRFSLKSAYMTKNLSECEQRSQNWLSFPSAEL